jgi:hypothetical protein
MEGIQIQIWKNNSTLNKRVFLYIALYSVLNAIHNFVGAVIPFLLKFVQTAKPLCY